MANENKEKSSEQEALEWFIKTKLTLLDAFEGIKGLTDGKLSKVVIGKTGAGVGAIIDYAQGHSVEEIAGKMFGTAVDALLVGKLRQAFKIKPDTVLGYYTDNALQGFAVLSFEGATDYSAADYFEKAFPAASQFYKTLYNDIVNGDGLYAREIWEGLKATADIDLIVNYYSTATFEQWFDDFKDLLNPSYTPPTDDIIYTAHISGNEQGHIVVDCVSDDITKAIVKEAIKHDELTKLTINSTTYDITKENNLTLKEQISDTPKEIQDNIQQNTEDMNSLELMKHWFQTDLNIDEKEFAEIINAIKNDESTPSSEAIRKNIEETTREWEKAQSSKDDDDNVHRQ